MPPLRASDQPRGMDPSVPAADGTCFFTKLPPELRNHIYAHALSCEHPLSHCVDNNFHSRLFMEHMHRDQAPVEFNQLQYVTRQFRNETRGLELHYNSVKFANYQPGQRLFDSFEFSLPGTSLDQCCFFLKECSLPRFKNSIRSILIAPDDTYRGPRPQQMEALLTFCIAHPEVKAVAHVAPAPRPEHPRARRRFVLDGLCWTAAYRDVDSVNVPTDPDDPISPSDLSYYRSKLRDMKGLYPVPRMNALNCHFFPNTKNVHLGTEMLFTILNSTHFDRDFYLTMFGSLQSASRIVYAWCEKGF